MSKLIGIDGLGGSGKTSYAHQLQSEIKGSVLFHLDDFIHPKKVRYNDDFEEWYGYYHLQWRYDYLIEKLLQPLKKGLIVDETIEFYNKETDSYIMREVKIPVRTTVIVEGVFLQRPELRDFFHCVTYLNVSQSERLERVLRRDIYIGSREEILHKYENRYFPAEQKYLKDCEPLLLADEVRG